MNVIVASKHPRQQWLTMEQAVKHCTQGIGIWSWASNDQGEEPDAVMACCGDTPTLETLAAGSILRKELPALITFFFLHPAGHIGSTRPAEMKKHPPTFLVDGCFLVRPTGFEPAAYRVGVIRPSSRKALRRKGLIGVAQIIGILKKNLGSLVGQGFRGFSR